MIFDIDDDELHEAGIAAMARGETAALEKAKSLGEPMMVKAGLYGTVAASETLMSFVESLMRHRVD